MRRKVIYWVSTGFLALSGVFVGVFYLWGSQPGVPSIHAPGISAAAARSARDRQTLPSRTPHIAVSGLCVSDRRGLGQYRVQPDALCRRTTTPYSNPFHK